MDPLGVWQGWSQEVRRLLPEMGVWQQRALALFSLGVASAKHCGTARVAAVVPGAATIPSTTRRFERWLANERLDVGAARAAVGAAVLEQGRGQTRWLALDETHQGRTETGARLGMLALRLVYRERAVPLAWVCYRPGEAEASFSVLSSRLMAEVAALVPPDTQVVLMTDRGLSWPSLIDQCRTVGWSFLGRVPGQTRIQTADSVTGQIRDPAHLDRLLLVLQLAACFVLAQGVFVLQHGLRHILERPDRHTLSLFSLGLRWLDCARLHFLSLAPHLSLPCT